MDNAKLVCGIVASAAALTLAGCVHHDQPTSANQGSNISQAAGAANEEAGTTMTGTVANTENGSQTRTYDLKGFERIQVGGAFKVNVVVGEPESIKITGEDVLFDHLEVNVSGGTLSVQTKGWFNLNHSPTLTVTLPKLNGFEGSGAVDANIKGVESSDFALGLSGAANATLTGSADSLKVNLSGSGHADMTEVKVNDFTLDGSGAGEIKLGDLSGNAKVRLSGASNVTAKSVKDLDCELSGASHVDMPATGDVKFRASGASSASVGPAANIVSQSVSGASSLSKN